MSSNISELLSHHHALLDPLQHVHEHNLLTVGVVILREGDLLHLQAHAGNLIQCQEPCIRTVPLTDKAPKEVLNLFTDISEEWRLCSRSTTSRRSAANQEHGDGGGAENFGQENVWRRRTSSGTLWCWYSTETWSLWRLVWDRKDQYEVVTGKDWRKEYLTGAGRVFHSSLGLGDEDSSCLALQA